MTDGDGSGPTQKLDAREIIVKKRTRRRRFAALSGWYNEYRVEIWIVAAVLLAIFLLVEPWDIREGIFAFVRRVTDTLSGTVGNTAQAVVRWFQSLTLSDATAFVILFIVGILAFWRARWRIVRNRKLWSTHCPECSSPDIHRTHRRLVDRLLGIAGFPVRRYRCGNCGWRGLRIYRKGYFRPVAMPPPPEAG